MGVMNPNCYLYNNGCLKTYILNYNSDFIMAQTNKLRYSNKYKYIWLIRCRITIEIQWIAQTTIESSQYNIDKCN